MSTSKSGTTSEAISRLVKLCLTHPGVLKPRTVYSKFGIIFSFLFRRKRSSKISTLCSHIRGNDLVSPVLRNYTRVAKCLDPRGVKKYSRVQRRKEKKLDAGIHE